MLAVNLLVIFLLNYMVYIKIFLLYNKSMSETYHRESVVVQQSDMHEQCDFTNYES